MNARNASERNRHGVNSEFAAQALKKGGRILLFALLAAGLLFLAVFSGIGLGNQTVTDSFVTGNVEGLDVAAAQNEVFQTSVVGKVVDQAYVSGGITVQPNNFASGTVYRHGYTDHDTLGSISQEYSNSGTRYFGAISGSLRQDHQVLTVAYYIELRGDILTLAQKGLLTIAVSGTVQTRTGSGNQDYGAGMALMGTLDDEMHKGTAAGILPKYISSNNATKAAYKASSNDATQTFSFSMSSTSTTKYIAIAAASHCNYGGVLGMGGQTTGVRLSNLTVKLTSRDTTAPTLDYSQSVYDRYKSSWVKSRTEFLVLANDNVDIISSSAKAVNASSGLTYTTTTNSVTGITSIRVLGTVNQAITVTATDYTGNSKSQSYDIYDLRLDGVAPHAKAIGTKDIIFVKTDTYEPITGPYSGAVTLLIRAYDAHSGISSAVSAVTVKNDTLGTTASNAEAVAKAFSFTYNSKSYASTDGYDRVANSTASNYGHAKWYKVDGVTNGSYSISITDNVGHVGSESVTFAWHDTQKPIVTSATYSTAWTNGPVTLTVVIRESAGATAGRYQNSLGNGAGLSIFEVYYYDIVQGKNVTDNITSSYDSRVTKIQGSEYYYEYTYKITLKYKVEYAFFISDKVGFSETQMNFNGESLAKTKIMPNIDQIAPGITKIEAYSYASGINGSSVTSAYTKDSIAIKTDFGDPNATNKNNGSGIAAIVLVDYNKLKNAGEVSLSYYKGLSYAQGLVDYYEYPSGNYPTTGNYVFIVNINSCYIHQYKIILFDQAGNSSDMSMVGKNVPWENGNQENSKWQYAYRDDITPTVEIYLQQGIGSPLTADSSGTYRFPWTDAATVEFWIRVIFGCSGGTLYSAEGSSGSFTSIGAWANGKDSNICSNCGQNHNRDDNEHWTKVVIEAEGEKTYRYRFINGTSGGGVSVDSISIVTRIDHTPPTVTFLGFGSGENFTQDTTTVTRLRAAIVGYMPESEFMLDDVWYTNSLFAYYLISDGYSGLLSTPQEYRDGMQSSSAKAVVTFTLNGYTYQKTVSYNTENGYAILKYEFWSIADIGNNAKKQGTPILVNDVYDIAPRQSAVYQIKFYDFIGNNADATNRNNSTELIYNVDPFPIGGNVTSVKTADGMDYDGSSYQTGWTKQKIIITINKKLSITDTLLEYRYITVGDQGNVISTGNWIELSSDAALAKTATLEIDASSRSARIEFRVKNKATDNEFSFYNGEYIFIRQDTHKPKLLAFFFSYRDDLVSAFDASSKISADVLMYYEAILAADDITYTFNRLSSNADASVWAYKTLYLYISATDNRGVGAGAGIEYASIKMEGTEYSTTRVAFTQVTGNSLYRSAATFGYRTASENYSYNIFLIDNQENSHDIILSTDGSSRKMMPVVDTVIPELTLASATYTVSGTNYSYLTADGKLNGSVSPIKNDVYLNFIYKAGISGASIYFKQREYKTENTDAYINVQNSSNSTLGIYSFLNDYEPLSNGWMPINGTATSTIWPHTIYADVEVMRAFGFLIVTKTGAFVYIDGGDVFIDTKAPIIDGSKTFFTKESDIANNTDKIVYANLYTYDATALAGLYTNDNIYVYFQIKDLASGMKEVIYRYSDGSDIISQRLTEVIVIRTVNSVLIEEVYYRLLMTENKSYQVTAYDVADNTAVSTAYTPKIDKVVPKVIIEAVTGEDNTGYPVGAQNVFTKENNVRVTITVEYGISGFSHLDIVFQTTSGQILFMTLLKADMESAGTNRGRFNLTLADEQYRLYTVNAYSAIKENDAKGGALVYGTADMRIAIDRSAPQVIVLESNIEQLTKSWHGTPEVLYFRAEDMQDAFGIMGSGIESIKITYRIGGMGQPDVHFVLDDDDYYRGYAAGSSEPFKLLHYVEYTLTLVDNAGNVSTLSIYPLLDTVTPVFNNITEVQIIDGESQLIDYGFSKLVNGEGLVYTPGTWSSTNITANMNANYSMSGYVLEVRTSSDASDYGSWVAMTGWSGDWYYDSQTLPRPPAGDALKTLALALSPQIAPATTDGNLNQYYQFRMRSGAGLCSEIVDIGRIQIDREKPVMNVTVKTSDGLNYGTPTATGILGNVWTKESITISISSQSALVSGYELQYRLSTNPSWTKVSTSSSGSVLSIQFNEEAKNATFTLSDSVNNVTYYFRMVSTAGITSDVFVAGNLCIDKIRPSYGIEAKTTAFMGESTGTGKYNRLTADEYEESEGSYSLTSAPWTKSSYVAISLNISSIGFSGAVLYINDVAYDSLTAAHNNTSLYYVIDKTSELRIRLQSNAGEYIEITRNVKIDKAIPVLYVSGISGRKSSNWDGVPGNSWYTSITNVGFSVGTLVNNVLTATMPESGFTIEYTTGTTGEANWISIGSANSTNFELNGLSIIQNVYRFRIVTGSGMSYTLGQAAYDNNETSVRTINQMKDIIVNAGGLLNHLHNNDFQYALYVDSNQYSIDLAQFLTLNNNGLDIEIRGNDYATYTLEKKVSGVYTVVDTSVPANTIYYRGDEFRLSYTVGEYIHRLTQYGVYKDGAWVGEPAVYPKADDDSQTIASAETSGSITFQINGSSYTVFAYFIKELTVDYENTVLYKQNSSSANVTGTTVFSYVNTLGAVQHVEIELKLSYANMQGGTVNEKQLAVGAYVVTASIAGVNAASFRLKNPTTLLLVKYFEEKVSGGIEVPNSSTAPYEIRGAADLPYIATSYYDSYTYDSVNGIYTLGEAKSYLTKHYLQKSDIALSTAFTGIGGSFSGSYDGANHKLYWTSALILNGEFGLFHTLQGMVKNLVVAMEGGAKISNVVSGGVLAAYAVGGSVQNVAVQAEFTLYSIANGGMLGGLIGKTENAIIGGAGVPVYADVRINNYGSALANAEIGGLIGRIGQYTKVEYSYTFGGMELYNVAGSVKAGAVFGELDNYVVDPYNYFFANRYYSGNVFVNDALVNGYSMSANAGQINDALETENTLQGLIYSQLVKEESAIANVTVAGDTVRNYILQKLYKDFDINYLYDSTVSYLNGLGTEDSPLEISLEKQIAVIDRYINQHYFLLEDVDMHGHVKAIAIHKIFAGSFDGNEKTFLNFAGDATEVEDGFFGLFARMNGTVKNLIYKDIDVEIAYNGNDIFYAGLVAGIGYENAEISNIITVGAIVLTAHKESIAGAIAGDMDGGQIYDIFNLANIKVSAPELILGGTVGRVAGTLVASKDEKAAPIFSLARVEGVTTGSNAIEPVFGDGVYDYDSFASAVFGITSNIYFNGKLATGAFKAQIVDFENAAMRSMSFSNGENVFNKVFNGIYPLAGLGTSGDKFVVSTAQDFAYINNMLYASYNIPNDITFTSFTTIGTGLLFTGSIDGKNQDSSSAEDGTVSALFGLTDALVYYNAGTITDLTLDISYTRTITEDIVFGAIAIYNTGNIRNAIVSGDITVNSVYKNTTVIVSGFVGIDYGGYVQGMSKLQNSISNIIISVIGANTVYVGGYIGQVHRNTTLRYGIGSGEIVVTNCNTVYAGTLVGLMEQECDAISIKDVEDYQYTVRVDGVVSTKLYGIIVGQ